MITKTEALLYLRTAMGHGANGDDSALINFRPGQWEAIDHIVNQRGKMLCVQRTGWGKSNVYFLSAKFMRAQGMGVTLIISPLLALMRNQLEAANRLGLVARKIDAGNKNQWAQIRAELLADKIDLLMITPMRLANDGFVTGTLQPIASRIGLLVIDEAHCISDWGHAFMPDYRRIGQIIERLPRNIAVLATTATANKRVEKDVCTQLGSVTVQRGPLLRESLALQNMRLSDPANRISDQASRLAWMADHIPKLPGSGIVYTLTTRDADRVALWLRNNGIDAYAYHSDLDDLVRRGLEDDLLHNKIKCLVATTALGMGYDKPDLSFVIHYQSPGSVVGYYQQVGRAGRAIPQAFGLLMAGDEDTSINQFFRDSEFPPRWQIDSILGALNAAQNGLSLREIEGVVNLRQSKIEKVLKILVVEPQSPVIRMDGHWYRTLNPYRLDQDRIDHLTHQRETEWAQMLDYADNQRCLMQFLSEALDDDASQPCGKCAVCLGHTVLPLDIKDATLLSAQKFIKHSEMPLKLNLQWDSAAIPKYGAQFGWTKQNIPLSLRGEEGRILSRWGEPVWGALVASGKAQGRFDDALVAAAVDMIDNRWPRQHPFGGVTCIPSMRHPNLVPDFARRLAVALGVPFLPVVHKTRETEPQKNMENRFHQCHNLDGAFAVGPGTQVDGAVLLVDDVVDSAWTLTLVSTLLKQAGATAVYPFALATTASK